MHDELAMDTTSFDLDSLLQPERNRIEIRNLPIFFQQMAVMVKSFPLKFGYDTETIFRIRTIARALEGHRANGV